jgi:hypothetical protein
VQGDGDGGDRNFKPMIPGLEHLETLNGASSPGSSRVIPGSVPGGVEQGLEAV